MGVAPEVVIRRRSGPRLPSASAHAERRRSCAYDERLRRSEIGPATTRRMSTELPVWPRWRLWVADPSRRSARHQRVPSGVPERSAIRSTEGRRDRRRWVDLGLRPGVDIPPPTGRQAPIISPRRRRNPWNRLIPTGSGRSPGPRVLRQSACRVRTNQRVEGRHHSPHRKCSRIVPRAAARGATLLNFHTAGMLRKTRVLHQPRLPRPDCPAPAG